MFNPPPAPPSHNYDDGAVDRSCPDKGLSKSERYFYDADAVRGPLSATTHPSGNGFNRNGVRISHGEGSDREWSPRKARPLEGAHGSMGHDGNGMRMPEKWSNPGGRNMRNWWALGPEPYPEAHFATFPSSVPRKAIAASTSERGCCPTCGAPWRRVVARQRLLDGEVPVSGSFSRPDEPFRIPANGIGHWRYTTEGRTIGWRPTCRHYDDRYRSEFPQARRPRKREQRRATGDWWRRVRRRPGKSDWPTVPAVVLDLFAGSGTTLAVARAMGRRSIGVELQAEYLPLIQARVAEAAGPLLEVHDVAQGGAQVDVLPLFDETA